MRTINATRRHGSRGMTLVELLLVIAILSVVMLAVISLYIPVHQSTVAQTQVSDVQSNLRLALKTMTRDLLIAGFLMPYDPIAFPDATFESGGDFHDDKLTTPGTENSANFIIRTRSVASDFARILNVVPGTVAGADFKLTVSDAEMVDNFPVGSIVRLFEPVAGNEIKNIADPDTDITKRAYTVIGVDKATSAVEINGDPPDGYLLITDIPEETVMIRVSSQNTPALQTIRYVLNDSVLKREVNGQVQILARNVDTSDTTVGTGTSFFDSIFTTEGRVKQVDIRLTGETKAIKDDAVSGEKKRSVETSVKLRNVN